MSAFKKFEEIAAWQHGRELVREIYAVTCKGTFAKDFGLREQMQRASVSICSNIAEGFERRGNREFVKFLWISKGSAAEVASQLYHAKDLGYISEDQFQQLSNSANMICAMIYRLISSIPDLNRIRK